MAVTIRHCSTCGDERPFERPPCADGHGDLCPELSCVDCGAALLIAALLEPLQPGSAEQPDVSSRAA
ncbi:hypothetical protein HKK74_31345 [Actinomadura alba]|uniref:Uncharacterized protein n=2 Tax=Actinomadura alba TaxID=406431 RepID=A0ABR7LYL9_9ACTN|nr:hypothetical protein [Actinomadura alba]